MEFGELAVLHLANFLTIKFTLDLRIKPLEQEDRLLSLQCLLHRAVGHQTRIITNRLVALLLRSSLLHVGNLTWLNNILEHENAAAL